MRYSLRLTEIQHTTLRSHLFPRDGNEAVALLLCGRRSGKDRHILSVQETLLIPHEACPLRAPDLISWPTRYVDSLLAKAHGRGKAIVKVHSHAEGCRFFSKTDDQSDRSLFTSIASLLDDGLPHSSLIMLPSGELFGRVVGPDGNSIDSICSIIRVGDDIQIWEENPLVGVLPHTERNRQAFGSGTISRLSRLSAVVVGCSGTGSVVVEQLARLGIGKLVLIDPDVVESKNLNRILNTCRKDSDFRRPKVDVLAGHILDLGFGQSVVPIQASLASPEALVSAGECDIAFGCVDTIEGRHLLNRLTTFYLMPYFDVGVRLDSDGNGGINAVAGAVHYLQPGRSSLLSRGVYSLKQLEAEEMRRINPALYVRQRKEGYIRGVAENRPAVISVNMLFAALAVNEFLARLHPFRNQPNSHFAYVPASLSEMAILPEPEGDDCFVLRRHVGRGDVSPLLDLPGLA